MQLLELSLAVTWDGTQVDTNAVGCSISSISEVLVSTIGKDCRMRWLLLGVAGIDSLKKDAKRPRMINHQYKAESKSLKPSLTAYRETLISCTGGQRK